jgi:hypothetical protein
MAAWILAIVVSSSLNESDPERAGVNITARAKAGSRDIPSSGSIAGIVPHS